jgi:hypothetical protein
MLFQKVLFGFGQVITIKIGLWYDRGDTNNSSFELEDGKGREGAYHAVRWCKIA